MNALTGFRSGWQHRKVATSSTVAINSDAQVDSVDRFDYAVDNSEDDTKEATLASQAMPFRKPIVKDERIDEPSMAKVHSTEFYPNK